MPATLAEAIDRLIEANVPLRKRRALAKLERQLAAALEKAFIAEGRAFLTRLAQVAPFFPPAVREVAEPIDWERLFEDATLQTTPAFIDSIQAAAEVALLAGMQAAIAELVTDRSFDLEHPAAVAYIEQHGANQVARIRDTTRETLRRIIGQAAEEGWSYNRTAKAIRERYKHFSRRRAKNIAVFECLPGDTLVSPFALPPCMSARLGPSPSFGPLRSQSLIDAPTGHVGGDGAQPAIIGATRRWYVGPLIHITTAGGHKLSGTPNHPVLTDRGWIGLGLLKKGDHVVCDSVTEAMGLRDPNVEDVPAQIGQIFDALWDSPGMLLQRIAGSDRDFHGDGMESKVDVVWTNRDLPLEREAAIGEPIDQELLALSDFALRELSTRGTARDRQRTLLAAASFASEFGHPSGRRGMSVLEESAPLFWASICPFEPDVLGRLTGGDAGPLEAVHDGIDRDAEGGCDDRHGLAGLVTLDEIADVEIGEFCGHVYNLITSHGSYVANGILLHNCGDAYEHGNMLVARDLQDGGLDMQKSWLSVGDSKVRPDHRANQEEGWIGLDNQFQDRSDRPPTDPGCRCTLLMRRKPDA